MPAARASAAPFPGGPGRSRPSVRCARPRRAALAFLLVLAAAQTPLHTQEPATTDTVAARPAKPNVARTLAEIAGLNVLINRVDCNVGRARDAAGELWACVTPAVWSRNIRYGWTWDVDAFHTNMFLHPFHGATYFNTGRANGLDFWEAAPLAFLGSLMWEYFGETERPSLNDLYNTGFGGVALGEVFHRLSALVRDDRRRGAGRAFREMAALPLDPVGTVHRWLGGGFSRVGPNPADRHPGSLGLVVQAGGRSADDSGSARTTTTPSILVDLAYGDPYRRPYDRPFDVFTVRMQVSPDGGGLNLLQVRGRLWAKELTDPTNDDRAIATVNQRFEYVHTAAYKFGGQSVEAGLVSGLGFFLGIDVRTELFAEGLMLGAVDAPRAGIQGSGRTYDFGPGLGAGGSVSFVVRGAPVVTAAGHWIYLHSVSGSPADHAVRSTSLELILPVAREVGLGAYAGWFHRRSDYAGRAGETTSFPELRFFVSWQPNRVPPIWEEPR